MAKNRVEFILSAEDGKAIQAATKLLEKVRETGGAMDDMGRKQGNSLDSVKDKLLGMVSPLGTIAGATKLVMDMFDQWKDRINAIKEAQEKAAQVSKSYGEAFGKIVVNMPGTQPAELQRIDELLRGISKERSLGEGGLTKLADAYAQVQSAIPLAPENVKFEAVRETAKLLELTPTENAAAVSLGIAKTMEGSGFQLNATQSLNLLRQQQTLGLVKEIGPIGESIPRLSAAARIGGVSLPEMQATAALMTQIGGDTGGDESVTALTQMVVQLMTRSDTVEKKLGMDATGEKISGNFFQRFEQMRNRYQAGMIDEAQLGELFPVISRGGAGKIAISELLGSGWDRLGEYKDIMTSPAVLQGDLTRSDLLAMQTALPAQVFQAGRRQMQSSKEAGRAADVDAAAAVYFQEEFESKVKGLRGGEGVVKIGKGVRDIARYGIGLSEEQASSVGYAAAFNTPAMGLDLEKFGLPVRIQPFQGVDAIMKLTKAMNLLAEQKTYAPRRYLPTGGDR